MSKPLTYTRFLECLDEHRRQRTGQPQRASMNRRTLSLLMDDIRIPPDLSTGSVRTIMGLDIEIDGNLPDNAIKIDGTVYNAQSLRVTSPYPILDDKYIERLRAVITGYRNILAICISPEQPQTRRELEKIDYLAWELGIGVGVEPPAKEERNRE